MYITFVTLTVFRQSPISRSWIKNEIKIEITDYDRLIYNVDILHVSSIEIKITSTSHVEVHGTKAKLSDKAMLR